MHAEDLIARVGAAAFAGMGVIALISPDRIPRTMGMAITSPAGRSEVRAVYGGFGLGVAAALVARDENRRREARRAAGVALLSMAGGRLLDAAITRQVSAAAGIAGAGEVALGVALLRV